MRYGINAECLLLDGEGPQDSSELIEPLMEAIEARGGEDVGVGTLKSERIIEIDVSVEADSIVEALHRAIRIVGGGIIDVGLNIDDVETQLPPDVLAQEKAARNRQAHAGGARRIGHIKWSLDPEERQLAGA